MKSLYGVALTVVGDEVAPSPSRVRTKDDTDQGIFSATPTPWMRLYLFREKQIKFVLSILANQDKKPVQRLQLSYLNR